MVHLFPYVLTAGRQSTTFNHQGWVTIGGKRDANTRLVRPFQGTVAGKHAYMHIGLGLLFYRMTPKIFCGFWVIMHVVW